MKRILIGLLAVVLIMPPGQSGGFFGLRSFPHPTRRADVAFVEQALADQPVSAHIFYGAAPDLFGCLRTFGAAARLFAFGLIISGAPGKFNLLMAQPAPRAAAKLSPAEQAADTAIAAFAKKTGSFAQSVKDARDKYQKARDAAINRLLQGKFSNLRTFISDPEGLKQMFLSMAISLTDAELRGLKDKDLAAEVQTLRDAMKTLQDLAGSKPIDRTAAENRLKALKARKTPSPHEKQFQENLDKAIALEVQTRKSMESESPVKADLAGTAPVAVVNTADVQVRFLHPAEGHILITILLKVPDQPGQVGWVFVHADFTDSPPNATLVAYPWSHRDPSLAESWEKRKDTWNQEFQAKNTLWMQNPVRLFPWWPANPSMPPQTPVTANTATNQPPVSAPRATPPAPVPTATPAPSPTKPPEPAPTVAVQPPPSNAPPAKSEAAPPATSAAPTTSSNNGTRVATASDVRNVEKATAAVKTAIAKAQSVIDRYLKLKAARGDQTKIKRELEEAKGPVLDLKSFLDGVSNLSAPNGKLGDEWLKVKQKAEATSEQARVMVDETIKTALDKLGSSAGSAAPPVADAPGGASAAVRTSVEPTPKTPTEADLEQAALINARAAHTAFTASVVALFNSAADRLSALSDNFSSDVMNRLLENMVWTALANPDSGFEAANKTVVDARDRWNASFSKINEPSDMSQMQKAAPKLLGQPAMELNPSQDPNAPVLRVASVGMVSGAVVFNVVAAYEMRGQPNQIQIIGLQFRLKGASIAPSEAGKVDKGIVLEVSQPYARPIARKKKDKDVRSTLKNHQGEIIFASVATPASPATGASVVASVQSATPTPDDDPVLAALAATFIAGPLERWYGSNRVQLAEILRPQYQTLAGTALDVPFILAHLRLTLDLIRLLGQKTNVQESSPDERRRLVRDPAFQLAWKILSKPGFSKVAVQNVVDRFLADPSKLKIEAVPADDIVGIVSASVTALVGLLPTVTTPTIPPAEPLRPRVKEPDGATAVSVTHLQDEQKKGGRPTTFQTDAQHIADISAQAMKLAPQLKASLSKARAEIRLRDISSINGVPEAIQDKFFRTVMLVAGEELGDKDLSYADLHRDLDKANKIRTELESLHSTEDEVVDAIKALIPFEMGQRPAPEAAKGKPVLPYYVAMGADLALAFEYYPKEKRIYVYFFIANSQKGGVDRIDQDLVIQINGQIRENHRPIHYSNTNAADFAFDLHWTEIPKLRGAMEPSLTPGSFELARQLLPSLWSGPTLVNFLNELILGFLAKQLEEAIETAAISAEILHAPIYPHHETKMIALHFLNESA